MKNYLYLIRCNEYFKIGIAGSVEARIANLQTGNPYPLRVIMVYAFDNAAVIEQALHLKFKSIRASGEWFLLSDEDVKRLDEICVMFDGEKYDAPGEVSKQAVEEAEVIQEIESEDSSDLPVLDFEKMFSLGYRIEFLKRGRYWSWRKRGATRKAIYGGTFESLPEKIQSIYSGYSNSETDSE